MTITTQVKAPIPCRHFGRQSGGFLQNYVLLPHSPAVVLLGISPKDLKTYPHKICTQIFIAAFYSELPNLERTKMDKSLWFIQTMEYDSSANRNELSSHKNTWKNLKYMILSQSEKAT